MRVAVASAKGLQRIVSLHIHRDPCGLPEHVPRDGVCVETIRGTGFGFTKLGIFENFPNEFFETFFGMRYSIRIAIRIATRLANNSTIIDGSIKYSTTVFPTVHKFMQNHFEWVLQIIRETFHYRN